jgi:excisionase family DNA binding protein
MKVREPKTGTVAQPAVNSSLVVVTAKKASDFSSLRMAYSIDEVAVQANIGRDKIYAAIRDGQLEAKKAGRRTLVMADALRRYLDALPSLQLPPAA